MYLTKPNKHDRMADAPGGSNYEHFTYMYNFFPILRIFQRAQRLKESETAIETPRNGGEVSDSVTTDFSIISKNTGQIPVEAPDLAKTMQNNYFTRDHQVRKFKNTAVLTCCQDNKPVKKQWLTDM